MDLSLIAASLSLLVLLVEPVFTRWNRYAYDKSAQTQKDNNKFQAAMKRKKHFKTVALFMLVFSAMLAAYSNQEEENMTADKFDGINESLNNVNSSVSKIGDRITKIEKFLWGGGPDGSLPDSPSGPNGGPDTDPDYLTVDERISRIEDAVSRFQKNAVTQDQIDEIHKEIIELRAAIKEYEEIMASLGVPAS